jgi:hypothetical protein
VGEGVCYGSGEGGMRGFGVRVRGCRILERVGFLVLLRICILDYIH